MTDYNAIDALLADARTPADLPPADQRRALRQALHLSRTQVAHALGVSPSTVGGWETGRDPSGELREKYAYFLSGAQEKLRTQNETPPHPKTGTPDDHTTTADEDAPRPTPQPCVLCGAPATDEVEGYPQHLHPDDCTHPTPAPPHPETTPQPTAPPAPHPNPTPAPRPQAPTRTSENRPEPAPRRRTPQTHPRTPDLITQAVQQALDTHAGDLTAATAELQRRAIPDAMALLDATRIGARYDIVGHPPLPDILRKKSAHGADEVWEARPHWTRQDPPPAATEVTALDINGAYLSALKTHLPLGALEYSTGNVHSRRRAGIHLITPPEWDHHPYLPNPLGNREEPGPVWVTEPTLRLLQRLATDQYGPLCDPPVIHESFTSGATEQLFEKFRQALRDAREKAITEEDEVTLEYVKSMYSKFVSTMGESNYNRALYRPDWMHIIRSQAFVNLWLKAHKAHTAGLTVMRVMGTDELHIAGDWRQVFTEGRGVSQVKVKDVYAATDTGHH
ncbi:helix-turn-helix transcriptional regulator [Streptomyces sp. DSM 110735]|uniref:helix-turn-helix domain-containing protein n=1 Tax=Streptomyces sp. DSM 110735 TaxID=2775031 RepID=UPI0018F385EB|nr:helix-turn-helix transcriptional regulator [Streptomyces sp. DSM 110735]MBJ7907660.1 helix-turn-helix transcriptional regulator [Streptomyces sp. DSM 110735]